MKKIIFSLLLVLGCFIASFAQIVDIPDGNFKDALVNGLCVDTDGDYIGDADADTNGDGEIQVVEAQVVTWLNVNGRNIQNLTGIQAFNNLEYLNCTANKLTNLDLQSLTNLQFVYCHDNELTSLQVQGLINLHTLLCSENQLTSLNVQGLTNLQNLHCHENQLTSLNVQGLTNLNLLACEFNQLTNLNFLDLANLVHLYCAYNQLPNLNVLGLLNLEELDCAHNQLTGLDLIGMPNLEYLDCSSNQLSSLNLQELPNLQELLCSSNQLVNLNLVGLTNLRILDCPFNQLQNLNLLNLANLMAIQCQDNQLNSLDVQNLNNLQQLNCNNNQLNSIHVQGLGNLKELLLYNNQLSHLNIIGLTNLQSFWCSNNPISCLSILPKSLTSLDAFNTNITCLPNIPQGIAATNTLPLCTPNNPNGCLFSARIYGHAYKKDFNGNCSLEPNDVLQGNILIQAKDQATQEVYTTSSKADGTYELGLPTPATYEVKALVANNNYWQSCSPQTVFLSADTVQLEQNVFIKPVVACADVEIDHQLVNIARPCSTAVYHASYFNAGTITATALTGKITLPSELTMEWASYPYTSAGDGVYHFALPDQAALSRDTFSFTAGVSCDAQMGQMLCTEVEVMPNTYCIQAGQGGWDGSDVEVSGHCVGTDSVRFVIQNVGTSNMTAAQNYVVIEDIAMVRGDVFQLFAGASDSITVAADPQKIYRIIAEETPNNPAGNTQETFMVWGCNGLNGLNWGFVNNFGLNNGASNPHQLCVEVRTSYDPNDISAIATGVGAEHAILKDTDLEYKIRFQNTGNDTAFVVRLVNKLPEELDPATLRIGSASHPFTWHLSSNGVLEFLFQNILLPDSTTNEPASNGFATYRIKTKPNLMDGTTINNQAGIYFDYNPIVLTNIYTHTIRETLGAIFLSTPILIDNQYAISVFPNPMRDKVTIEVKNARAENLQFTLYNMLGQIVKTQDFDGATLVLDGEGLSQGTYFYSVSEGGFVFARGTLVVD